MRNILKTLLLDLNNILNVLIQNLEAFGIQPMNKGEII
jgi:hypothetical protein